MKGNSVSDVSKKDQEEIRGLSESKFEAEWTKAAGALEEAKARTNAFSEEAQRRATAAKIATMNPDELRAIAQFVNTEGIDSEEAVQNG